MIQLIGSQESSCFFNQVILMMTVTDLSRKLMENGLILQMMQLIIMINIQEIIRI